MDETKIAELKAAHGDNLTLIEIGDDELVVKKPTRAQFNRFRESVVNGGKERVEGGATLIRDALVYPSWKEFLEIVERAPAIEDEVTGQVAKLAQSESKVSAKKL